MTAPTSAFAPFLPQGGFTQGLPQVSQGQQPLIRLKVNRNVYRGELDTQKHIHLVPVEGQSSQGGSKPATAPQKDTTK